MRPPSAPSYTEIERRAEEALSGTVKMISAQESRARIDRLISEMRHYRACSGMSRLLIIAAIFFGMLAPNTRADEERSADQKEAYQLLVAQYPSTVEKAFKNDAERKSWHKFVTTDDPVHVRISRISANYEGQMSLGGSTAYTLYKSARIPPNPDDWWRIEVFGEMTPSVQSIIIFISTTSKKIVLARFQSGE